MSEDLWRFFGAQIGVTDFVLLLFRTTPFNWHDLSLIDSAMQVMNHYVSGIGFVAIGAVIAACIVLIVVLFKKAARLEKRPNYKKGCGKCSNCGIVNSLFFGVLAAGLQFCRVISAISRKLIRLMVLPTALQIHTSALEFQSLIITMRKR